MNKVLTRREFLKLAGLTLITTGLGSCRWKGLPERSNLANLTPAKPNAPNILLIVLDTVRAQNMGLYGSGRPTTPNLDRLARSGVVFERAIPTAPWTLPSLASMFTGRWHYELSTDFISGLDNTYPTLAEAYTARGYYTAGFVANLGYCSYENGLHRGFIHYEDHLISLESFIASSSIGRRIGYNMKIQQSFNKFNLTKRISAAEINDNFLQWQALHTDRPFFVFLNYYDAHAPYLPPDPFDSKFGLKRKRGNPQVPKSQWSHREIQAEIDAYDGEIAYIDHQIGQLFNELEKRELLENTLIIITSDHGEQLGEQGGLFGHSNGLYIQTLHVPLVMIFPTRIPEGLRIQRPVSLRDLPNTIFDLTGKTEEFQYPGNSFIRNWETKNVEHENILSEVNYHPGVPEEDWYPLQKGDMKSLIKNQYHYILNGDGREELYDLDNDPSEHRDIAGIVGEDVLKDLRASLKSTLSQS